MKQGHEVNKCRYPEIIIIEIEILENVQWLISLCNWTLIQIQMWWNYTSFDVNRLFIGWMLLAYIEGSDELQFNDS